MEHITKVVTDIVKSLNSNEVTFDEYDTCPEMVHFVSIEGRSITIQNDIRNQDLRVVLENFRKGDKKVTGPDLLNVFVNVLGPVTDGVLNWFKDDVLVILEDDVIEISQHYR